MNLDAAIVMRAVAAQPVARQTRSIAKVAELPLDRTRGALVLLEAVGKVRKTGHGLWEKT